MIYIKIGIEERRIENAHPQWITQSIQGLRQSFGLVCVQVRFDVPGIQLLLSTPGCSTGGGKPIACFNAEEQRIIAMWRDLGLFDDPSFEAGRIVAFVQQLRRCLGLAA